MKFIPSSNEYIYLWLKKRAWILHCIHSLMKVSKNLPTNFYHVANANFETKVSRMQQGKVRFPNVTPVCFFLIMTIIIERRKKMKLTKTYRVGKKCWRIWVSDIDLWSKCLKVKYDLKLGSITCGNRIKLTSNNQRRNQLPLLKLYVSISFLLVCVRVAAQFIYNKCVRIQLISFSL